jgi:glycosyltransferase involved in cell wall biosynthesis
MKPLRIGLVCFRLRPEIPGGAEHYVMRLAAELQKRGHDVSLLTTTATHISQPDRWRVHWQQDPPRRWWHRFLPPKPIDEVLDYAGETLKVRRMAIGHHLPGPWFYSPLLQASWESAEDAKRRVLAEKAETSAGLREYSDGRDEYLELGPGWQLPEFPEGQCRRWTIDKPSFVWQCGNPSQLIIRANNIWCNRYRWVVENQKCENEEQDYEWRVLNEGTVKLTLDLPETLNGKCAWLEIADTKIPDGEVRNLGLYVESISWQINEATSTEIRLDKTFTDIQEARRDMRALGFEDIDEDRKDPHIEDEDEFFKIARGPLVANIKKYVSQFSSDKDVLGFASMPFASFNWGQELHKGAPPWFVLPFRHAEDPYYQWVSYIEVMQQATGIFTLTPAELSGLPDEIQQKGWLLSGGADDVAMASEETPATYPTDDERKALREKLNLPMDGRLVLSLGRKNPNKGYRELSEGVALANQQNEEATADSSNVESRAPKWHLVMAGPDEDGLPLDGDHAIMLGKVSEETKRDLFRACDLLGFFSQSESFGLVMIEAWLGGCLVLAGTRCGAAKWVAEQLGSFLCANMPEAIAEQLLTIQQLPETDKAEQWQRGYETVQREFQWKHVAERFEAGIEHFLSEK